MSKLRTVVGWGLLVLLGIFMVLNWSAVTVHILIGTVSMPVGMVILLSAVLGAVSASTLKRFRKPPAR
ncbi:MAG TPA: LapA family protein [Planctomycetota bacterium]|jgi:uncharacterized integral membrane protein|nr:LapA family protein [Planctomycetota bacterium]